MAEKHYFRNASNLLTFTIFDVDADDYPKVCGAVAKEFGLVKHGIPTTDFLALVFQHYHLDDKTVEMAWDNWMGFHVTAQDSNSEPLVYEIGAWLLKSDWAKKSS